MTKIQQTKRVFPTLCDILHNPPGMTYSSTEVSRNSIEVISVAVIFAVYTAVSSIHMLRRTQGG